jgi:hypothetical protein
MKIFVEIFVAIGLAIALLAAGTVAVITSYPGPAKTTASAVVHLADCTSQGC